MMGAYDFQSKAIEALQKAFAELWPKEASEPMQVVLKSPTGSGKTFMTCKFIDSLQAASEHLPQGLGDVAFFWISMGDMLPRQSREKFGAYFGTALRNTLTSLAECGERLTSDSVVFVNWEKLSQTRGKERLRLRRPGDPVERKEQGVYFEDVIENTRKEGRQIVMVIDESHTHVDTANSQDLIKLISPKVILKVSATPFKDKAAEDAFYAMKGRGLAEIVEVPREKVVKEGLVKDSIECQTEEELKRYSGKDLDEAMLELAMKRRESIMADWTRFGEKVNPLVLVQLPNADHARKETAGEDADKQEFVRNWLKAHGVSESRIATRLDDKPWKPEWRISENDSDIDYLLFKYAAGTGWDCPRAHVLVMFREIDSPVFRTQTLGRIERTAVHDEKLSGYPQLRTGYLYTTYSKNEVGAGVDPATPNKPKIHISRIEANVRTEGAKTAAVMELGGIFCDIVAKVAAKPGDGSGGEDDESETTDGEETPQARERRKKFEAEVEETWQSHAVTLGVDADGEVQAALAEEVVALAEKASGATLGGDERRRIAETVAAHAEVVTGVREGSLIIDPILKSDFESRASYGDLGKTSEFQKSFLDSMDRFFGMGKYRTGGMGDEECLKAHGVDTEISLKQDVMVGVKFFSEDSGNAVAKGGADASVEVSRKDVERLFTNYCADILKETYVGNVARSWSVLREGLRQWYRTMTIWTGDKSLDPFYRIAVKDFTKDSNSVLKKAILEAIRDYKPILDEFNRRRTENARRQSQTFKVMTTSAYTDDFAQFTPSAKSVRQPFYLRKEYKGRENETRFIEHLEGNVEVKTWMKNADSGQEALSIRYRDETDGSMRLFNPDWLVFYANGDIGIYDTKEGQTGMEKSQETQWKCAALMERVAWLNANSEKKYRGGIYEYEGGQWVLKTGKGLHVR